MRHAQIVRTHTAYGAAPQTHVYVEIYEVLGAGLRRQLEAIDMTFEGAAEYGPEVVAAVEQRLVEAELLAPGDKVLTEAEARAMAAGRERT